MTALRPVKDLAFIPSPSTARTAPTSHTARPEDDGISEADLNDWDVAP